MKDEHDDDDDQDEEEKKRHVIKSQIRILGLHPRPCP